MTKKLKDMSTNGDPMRLQASRKERRRETARREDLQRKHLSYLLNMKSITPNMFRGAMYLHEKHLISTGGMQAMDWLREKVDGGKHGGGEPDMRNGLLDAEAEIKRVFRGSGISFNQIEIVMMVVLNEESLASVGEALARRRGSPIAGAAEAVVRGYVGALLRDALTEIYKFIYEPNRDDVKTQRVRISAWLADDAVPQDRPDLREVVRKHSDAA
tara:strand:- start:4677 stop:5321 length:645 start_codon:yes stop_codon:yes gene_type:complete